MNASEQAARPFPERDSICVSHYPIPVSNPTPQEAARLMELDRPKAGDQQVALYLHIPFCDLTCSFCPFNKYVKHQDQVDRYLAALKDEIALYGRTAYGKSAVIGSINLGGGTPSCLTLQELTAILQAIKGAFTVAPDAMIFVEGNPRNFTRDKLAGLRAEGLSRISVGVQTFQPRLGGYLNLYHTVEDSERLLADARELGIDNIGIDLMYNLPGQTDEDWRADIETSIALGIDHICLISFCVVPHTPIAEKIRAGEVPSVGTLDDEIRFYAEARRMLLAAGYEQYSVIDFALPGKIDRHAAMYFGEQSDLIGIGSAAFGFLNGYMYINDGNLAEYIDKVNAGGLSVACGEKSAPEEFAHGMMAKGLRMLSVDRGDFRQRFGCDPEDLFPDTMAELTASGLIEADASGVRLTEQGIIWGNNVCKAFFSEKYKNYGLQARMKLAKGRPVQSV